MVVPQQAIGHCELTIGYGFAGERIKFPAKPLAMINWQWPIRLLALEEILQRELDAPSGRDRVGRRAESGRFEPPHGDAEILAIDEVEELSAEDQLLIISEDKVLHQRQIEQQVVARAERVAPLIAIGADGGKQRSQL